MKWRALVTGVAVLSLAGAAGAIWLRGASAHEVGSPGASSAAAAKEAVSSPAGAAAPLATKPPVRRDRSQIPPHRVGARAPSVQTTASSYNGMPATVSCATCHTTVPPNRTNGEQKLPDKFHLGLQYQHGGQSCLSCHNADNYDTLRQADGRSVPFNQAQQLCAQCHGPQSRDYVNGSHGGMNGYWDLSRGPRRRNTCTDCHDPHAPAYPQVQPVFPPRDRGARQQAARDAAASAHSSADHP